MFKDYRKPKYMVFKRADCGLILMWHYATKDEFIFEMRLLTKTKGFNLDDYEVHCFHNHQLLVEVSPLEYILSSDGG